jgi:chitin synthase
MFVYLTALPIWNFVLPVYAFWHFDDFSWGETRVIEGEIKGEGEGENDNIVSGRDIEWKTWVEWETERRNYILQMSSLNRYRNE